MRVSSRGDYGLRAMVHLARLYGSGPVSVAELAALEGLPSGYLEQIVAGLRRAGLIASCRGRRGGYTLSAEPASISVGDVLRALEGPLRLMPCAAEAADQACCEREEHCPCRDVWRRVRDAVVAVVDSTTLEDLRRDSPLPASAATAGDASASRRRQSWLH